MSSPQTEIIVDGPVDRPLWPARLPVIFQNDRRLDLQTILKKARQQDRASFFEEQGLIEFLHLDWDIEEDDQDLDQIQEFLKNYDQHTETVTMTTREMDDQTVTIKSREIAIDNELLGEVFHLPVGSYKLRINGKKGFSPYFDQESVHKRKEEDGYVLSSCNDKVWLDRFAFLHFVFCSRTESDAVTYDFMEFLQAGGEKRDWVDAFRWFFEDKMIRLWGQDEVTIECTMIRHHIKLILAHIQRKEKSETEDPTEMRVGRLRALKTHRASPGPQSLSEGKEGNDEENEPEREQQKEDYQHELEEKETVPPLLDTVNVEGQILRHHDVLRRGTAELLNRIAGLRDENLSLKNEVEFWKNEWRGTSGLREANVSLKKQVEHWKSEYKKAEQGRKELEAKVATLFRTEKVVSTNKLNKNSSSLCFTTPPLSKKARPI